MSLRRTPLARKSPLQQRTSLRARSSLKASSPLARKQPPAKRPNSTGPSGAVRAIVTARAIGCCEICLTPLRASDIWIGAHSFHHRRPRQMGGTVRPETNGPANLLLVCGTGTTGCHGTIEANRAAAYEQGWLVRQNADPREVPVALRVAGPGLSLVRLDDEGGHWPVTA